jgi:putative exosortase-associated protein (TIGR04073 family)
MFAFYLIGFMMKISLSYLISLLAIAILGMLSTNIQAVEPDQLTAYSYSEKVEQKATNGFINIATAPLEIPKNIINTTNDSNLLYGFTGGLFKGIVHMLGRMSAGFADVITLPLPTKIISEPVYIWEDFDTETTYNPIFRLDDTATPADVVN